MSPAACCFARAASRAVSATDSRIGLIWRGQGCPPRAGTGASARGITRSASLAAVSPRVPGAGALLFSQGTGGRVMAPVRALRMAMFRSWARAARAVCRQIPSKFWVPRLVLSRARPCPF